MDRHSKTYNCSVGRASLMSQNAWADGMARRGVTDTSGQPATASSPTVLRIITRHTAGAAGAMFSYPC